MVLLAIAALALGADMGARALAEARLAASVEDALELGERPHIELEGFPFLLQVARGRLDTLSVQVEDVTLEGLPFQRVALSLDGLGFDRGSLLGGGGDVAVSRGSAQAVLSQDALSGYLQDRGTPVIVRLEGPGIRVSTRISAGAETTTATAEGRVRVEEGSLVFSPREVEVEGAVGVPAAALGFAISLPDLVPGISYRRVLVHDGIAAIEADLSDARLELAD